MLARIIAHDLRLLIRDRTFALVVLLFAALLAYGFWNGASLTRMLERAIQANASAAKAALEEQRQQIVDVRVGKKKAADIFGLGKAYGVQVAAALPPSPLAPLSLGASEVLPSSTAVTIFSTKDELVKQSELDNPMHLLAGRFDPSFLFIYLYPLLVLALSYNLLSHEKEQGTLALTLAQPVSLAKLLLGKTLARAGVLLGLALAGTLIALLAVGVRFQDSGVFAKLLLWFGAIAAYTGFWFAFAVLVNLLGKSSATNAALLAAVWLLLVIIYPALLNAAATTLHPLPSRLQFINNTRAAESELNRDAANLLAKYMNDHPELAQGDPEKNAKDFQLRYFVQKQEIERRTFVEALAYDTQLARQQETIARFGFISPAITLQQTMDDLAGTSRRRHADFAEQVRELIDHIRATYAPIVAGLGSLTEEDYERVPHFTWQEENLGESMRRNLLTIAFLLTPTALIALLAAFYVRRYPIPV